MLPNIFLTITDLELGIRRIARFDYENREKPFYDGTETNVALSAPTAAVNGWEYLFHF